MAKDIYLQISTIPGESTDDQHKEWIEISSFSHGLSQMGTDAISGGSARTFGRCDHQDFSISKSLDKATPLLALTCSNGEHIEEIKIELCRASKDKGVYMEYLLTDCIVSSVNYSGSDGSGRPMESVTFNYATIQWTYTDWSADGKKGGQTQKFWNLKENLGG